MDGLFGAEGSLIVRFVVAFVIVLALIGATFWVIRRFGGTRVGTAAQRGRQPRLAVIDAAAGAVKQWVALPGIAYGTATTPDGKYLLITVLGVNKVAVLDLKSMQIAQTIDVPAAPQEIVVRPDGKTAYVSCDASKKVAAIDTATWKVEKLIDAGAAADGLAWAAAR